MKTYLVLCSLLFVQCTISSSSSKSEKMTDLQNRILFVVSNAQFYGDSDLSTANHFSEIVLPYDVLTKANYEIDIVSPKGGTIPIGYIDTTDILIKNYLSNHDFMKALKETKKPSEINAADYKVIFYGGGGSAMYGVPENEEIQKIAMQIYEDQNGIISAVCHGTAGIVHLKTKEGKYFVEDKILNGFPDKFEKMDAEYYQEFPFSIEQIVEERGGDFEYSEQGWDGFHKVDGRLITGQDPTGAATVASKIVELLSKDKSSHK